MDPLISVILPIYNVENYIERAIESVLRQTYQNLEIILVDDGSPDRCGEICDAYARRDARIKVIHKPNGGLSDARNAGLDVMKGAYVAFVDSDDYIAPFFIEALYQALVETGSDVSLCRYAVVTQPDMSECETKLANADSRDYVVYDRKQTLLNLYDAHHEDATYFIVAWNKLYAANLWKTVRFPKGKVHEDEGCTYLIFDQIRRSVYVKQPMYGYFSAPDSITRAAFNMKRLDWFDALDDRIIYFKQKGDAEHVAAAMRARADGAVHYYYQLVDAFPKETEQAKRLQGYVKAALSGRHMEQEISKKARIGYRLFLHAPALYRRLTGC